MVMCAAVDGSVDKISTANGMVLAADSDHAAGEEVAIAYSKSVHAAAAAAGARSWRWSGARPTS